MSSHVDTNGKMPHELEKATLEGKNKVLGFWLFLGGESILFGTLFATFIALRDQVMDGPSAPSLFSLPLVALATFLLLTSSLTSVLAVQGMHRHDVKSTQLWLGITVALGIAFLLLEIYEFYHYVHMGHGFTTSAFSSAFYTLVGFHGAHVAFGIVWISLVMVQTKRIGLNVTTAPKIYIAGLYWHFVDLVWVFIFTVVYLMGKLG